MAMTGKKKVNMLALGLTLFICAHSCLLLSLLTSEDLTLVYKEWEVRIQGLVFRTAIILLLCDRLRARKDWARILLGFFLVTSAANALIGWAELPGAGAGLFSPLALASLAPAPVYCTAIYFLFKDEDIIRHVNPREDI